MNYFTGCPVALFYLGFLTLTEVLIGFPEP